MRAEGRRIRDSSIIVDNLGDGVSDIQQNHILYVLAFFIGTVGLKMGYSLSGHWKLKIRVDIVRLARLLGMFVG